MQIAGAVTVDLCAVCRYIAVIQVNKTIGRPQESGWILGRTSRTHSAQTGKDVPLFVTATAETGGYERNASLLSSPPEFYVLTNGMLCL